DACARQRPAGEHPARRDQRQGPWLGEFDLAEDLAAEPTGFTFPLATTLDAPGGTPAEGRSRVTSDIQPCRDVARFAVTHENLADDKALGLAAAPQLNHHERRRARIGGRDRPHLGAIRSAGQAGWPGTRRRPATGC